jgi:hypothetical protein
MILIGLMTIPFQVLECVFFFVFKNIISLPIGVGMVFMIGVQSPNNVI